MSVTFLTQFLHKCFNGGPPLAGFFGFGGYFFMDEKRTQSQDKYRFQSEIQQMMFVFGEVSDPLQETTMLVEDIVRSQVIEIIIQAAAQASRRRSRYLSAEDLIFLMRHDRAKVNRLRSFLSWKDVRKNAKDASGDQVEEMVEDSNTGKLHRSIIKLPWELVNQFSDVIVKSSNPDEESEDEDELEAYNDSIQRLRDADEVTRAMTREEYVHYSECRQASFTYRKSKRFREWANMSSFVEVRPNDDIVDSLGFLTYEMVSKLTTTALKIKQDLMEATGKKAEEPVNLITNLKRKREGEDPGKRSESADAEGPVSPATAAEREGDGLFSLPTSEQTPLQPEHIHEAFRRLQQVPQPLKNFRGGLARTRVSLI
ncbi:transcription initiation factor IID, 18kD subunit-domain-containing protein [Radiomyces spectabilis]|uniref:transcription initiation factor IID, 18kD subunit-domain-containing protein n=1 Tax=Radiomyces spectabilis TaxID=64574 RepID=UPI002220C4D0|nr:transcription initiation factor IID, 18kD subunit-domain-containing protein [Radiomyces spectabilis]KAI8369479.1 transcription initiation factor IID, 18kD subunit-domain-containing protein [Radiomyces spectabilis]